MTPIRTLTLATVLAMPLAFTVSASAQTTAAPAAAPMEGMKHSADMAEGEVRKVSKDTGKLTIKHGPIKSMDMPPMTMVFTAKDAGMLDKVAVGDKVRFVVVDQAGQMVITELQPLK